MTLSTGAPVQPADPYAQYAVGSLTSNDFSSFTLTFTGQDLSAVPITVQWKDANGNSLSMVKTVDLRSLAYSSGTGSTRTGSSGSGRTTGSASTAGSSGAANRGGGGSMFGIGGEQGRGFKCVLPGYCRGNYSHCRYCPVSEEEMDTGKVQKAVGVDVMDDLPLIRLRDVSKTYHLESGDFTALNHVSLDIAENEFVAIMGPSGSGKSTMMNQLGILDVPTSGELLYRREECGADDKP